MDSAPTYYAGEWIKLELIFNSKVAPKSVTAKFRHEETQHVVELYGDEAEYVNTAGGRLLQVAMHSEVTADDPTGLYVCEALEAEYRGGRKVAFARVPNNLGFRIELEDIPPPEGFGWGWGTETFD